MISKKDKYRLRALANTLKPIVIIGKDGFNENVLKAINDAIKTNELIKISALKTYKGINMKELGMLIASTIDGDFIFSVGNTCIVYKKNKDINHYEVK